MSLRGERRKKGKSSFCTPPPLSRAAWAFETLLGENGPSLYNWPQLMNGGSESCSVRSRDSPPTSKIKKLFLPSFFFAQRGQ